MSTLPCLDPVEHAGRHADALDFARRVIDSQVLIERARVHPWVVTVSYTETRRYGDTSDSELPRYQVATYIVTSPLHETPAYAQFVPKGAQLVRADVFPAARFDDMPEERRERHRAQYRAFLMWQRARRLGKEVHELVPWSDHDPITVDDAVYQWIRGRT